jgi:hypothetical protein
MPSEGARRFLLLLLLGCCAVLTGGRCSAQNSPASPRTLATFRLEEFFRVSWPEQPIEFRYDGGRPPLSSTRMLGPNGTEVPYQWVSSCSDPTAIKGCILVVSDLPAKARYAWTLQAGVPPASHPDNPVKAVESSGAYQITNGRTGVRIIAPPGNPKPWNRAPIQGILLPDGTWAGAGPSPNLLYAESGSLAGAVGAALQTPMQTATGYEVTVVDSGPMKFVIRATYTFNRPRYFTGTTTIENAGAGHYALTVTMYANSKSILIDEDSDMQFSYYLPVYAQIHPRSAAMRPHLPSQRPQTPRPSSSEHPTA